MASAAKAPAAQTQTVLPEEIWEEIFLRVDAAADLARASAACTSFRRIVSTRRFLRRFRSLHSPPLLGFISRDSYGYRGFLPVEPPHRSAPEARPLVPAADFTFSFLPDPSEWHICNASEGRVLLSQRISTKTQFEDFVVCDPLHRRYVMIPRIPDDLMASAPRGGQHLLPVLAPAGEGDEEESFGVICTVKGEDKVVGFIFSPCNQTWRGIISTISLPDGYMLTEYKPYYAHRCFYWIFCCQGCKGYSLMLDTSEMEFSTVGLPRRNLFSICAIVEAADGRLGFVIISHATSTIDLYSKNCQSNGVGTQEWQCDTLIRLPKDFGFNYRWDIAGTVGHYVALIASRAIDNVYFVLDTKTLLLEKVCTSKDGEVFYDFPYARFPPVLAPPSI